MTDAERIEQLEREVLDLRDRLETIWKLLNLDGSSLPDDFRERSTIPAPPPSGV